MVLNDDWFDLIFDCADDTKQDDDGLWYDILASKMYYWLRKIYYSLSLAYMYFAIHLWYINRDTDEGGTLLANLILYNTIRNFLRYYYAADNAVIRSRWFACSRRLWFTSIDFAADIAHIAFVMRKVSGRVYTELGVLIFGINDGIIDRNAASKTCYFHSR